MAAGASLIEPCELNGIDPLGYLADVLTRIVNGHPNSQINDLLPSAHVSVPDLKAKPENIGYPPERLTRGIVILVRSAKGTQ